MKLSVKIDNQVYEVEIENLNARPIIAIVAGERFEVWPENELASGTMNKPAGVIAKPAQASTNPSAASVPAAKTGAHLSNMGNGNGVLKYVRAPIPGIITALSVQPGAEVTAGQQLCVLDAMKMNNSIRSSRAGRIAEIHVSVGQHVKHNDILIEFAE